MDLPKPGLTDPGLGSERISDLAEWRSDLTQRRIGVAELRVAAMDVLGEQRVDSRVLPAGANQRISHKLGLERLLNQSLLKLLRDGLLGQSLLGQRRELERNEPARAVAGNSGLDG